MPNLKMPGSTPYSGKSLCHTCKHSIVVRGQNCEEVILCSEAFYKNGGPGVVPFRVSDCTVFKDKTHPEKYEMEAIAWNVEAKRRGAVGFEQGSSEMEIVITEPKRSKEGEI